MACQLKAYVVARDPGRDPTQAFHSALEDQEGQNHFLVKFCSSRQQRIKSETIQICILASGMQPLPDFYHLLLEEVVELLSCLPCLPCIKVLL